MRSSVRFAESEEPEEYPLTPTPRDDDANPRHGGDFTKKMRRKTGTILAGHEAEGLTEEGVVWAEKAKVREQQILKNEMEMRETHGKELRQLRAELREEKVVAMEHELLYQTLQGKYDALEQAMESEVAKRIHEETEKLYARKVEMEENEHRLRQEQAELERERQHLEDTIEEQRTTNGAHGESRMRRFVLRMAHGRLQTGWSRLVLVTHALKHAESAESLAEISARHERAVAAAASVERDATAKLSQLARERDVLRSEHSETSAAAAQASAALKTTARARNTAETQVEVLSKEKATLSAELKSIRRELRSAENDRSGAEGDAARGVRENERNRAALAEKTAALDASERALRVKQAAWTKEATSLKASVDGLERRLRRAEAEAKTAELARVSAVRDATGIAAELEHLNARNAAQVDELAAAHAAAQDAQANAHATDRVRAAKGHAALSEQAERLVAAKVKAHNAEKTKLCAAHHKAVAAAERRDADLMAQIAAAKGEAARAERARAAAHQRSLKAAEEEQRRTHTAALSAARLVHATAIDDHASQHARKLAALDTSHRNALKVAAADAAAATTAAVASEKLKHLQVQARRDAEHSAAVEALHRAHTAELERRDEGFAQELETLRIMEEKKRRALAGELSNTVDEAKRVHSAELAGSREMATTLQRELTRASVDHQQGIAEAEAKRTKELDASAKRLSAQHDVELRLMREQHERALFQYETWEAALNESHEVALSEIVSTWRQAAVLAAAGDEVKSIHTTEGGTAARRFFITRHDGTEYGPYSRTDLQRWADDDQFTTEGEDGNGDPPTREFGAVRKLSDVVVLRPTQMEGSIERRRRRAPPPNLGAQSEVVKLG